MLFFCQKSLIFANNMMKNMQIPFKTGCKCPLFQCLILLILLYCTIEYISMHILLYFMIFFTLSDFTLYFSMFEIFHQTL